MSKIQYKELSAEYAEETAKALKEHHNIDIEKELMEILKSEYKNKKK